jgi:hypothetical protein
MILRVLALIVALPSIILLVNLTAFALTGTGPLPPATEQAVHDARLAVGGMSMAGAITLLVASYGA